MTTILLAALLIFLPRSLQQEDCTFIANDSDAIFFTEDFEYLYPNEGANTTIPSGGKFIIDCTPGNLTNGWGDDQIIENSTVTVECDNSNLYIDGRTVIFENLYCENYRLDSARPLYNFCPFDFFGLEVGFDIGVNDVFAPLYQVCFDNLTEIPFFVQYNISTAIKYQAWELIYASDNLVDDEYYYLDVDVYKVYSINNQRETINSLVGLPADSDKYINFYNYLDKMPLAIAGNFFFNLQQFSAYRTINSVPIWVTNENWIRSLHSVLDYARNIADVDLIAYTGIYGNSTLPHEETGEDIEIVLYANGNVTAFPVPALLWSLVYEPNDQTAVVLVIVNNIYRLRDEDILCDDVSDQLEWLNWYRQGVEYGYFYACAYDDLTSKIPYLPMLNVNGLLTV